MSVNGRKNLSNLKAVIFDYGEVLCLPPTAEDVSTSARIAGVSPELFLKMWNRHRDPYDRGDLSQEEYWKKFGEDVGKPLGDRQLKELAARDVVMWSRTNPSMVAWLENLTASGMKTAVLSNMHADMVKHARASFHWLTRVHCATFSAEVRLIKPEPAIYEYCLRCLGVAAPECLFIDDREVNLAAARAMGIHGILFESGAQLKSDLEAAGLSALLPAIETGNYSSTDSRRNRSVPTL
jgi:putative hydrolase of the HAD superfamily